MGGWKTKKLGEVCDFQGGSQPPKSKFINTPQEDYIRLLQIRDFKSDDKAVYIPVSQKNKICSDDDIMIGRYGASVGQIHRGKRGAYNVALIRTIPNDREVVRNFFFHYLKSSLFQKPLLTIAGSRSAQAGFSKLDIADFPIPLPPIPEQKQIVEILDEAFAAIATATANAEKNLANARELFESQLRSTFDQGQPEPVRSGQNKDKQGVGEVLLADDSPANQPSSRTRGRAATDRVIVGDLSLSVGKPPAQPRPGWCWSRLTKVARLESGHTPSRRHPEYWDGEIPWIGIKDARAYHGKTIADTLQHTNQDGLSNSSARLLPRGTVCLSRTASVGYVVMMGKEMATSQDFVNWTCGLAIDPYFLKYLLLAEGDGFAKYSSGAVHQTIYFPEVKAFYICHPTIEIQRRIVMNLDRAGTKAEEMCRLFEKKLCLLTELKQSILHKAFTGELTADKHTVDREFSVAGI